MGSKYRSRFGSPWATSADFLACLKDFTAAAAVEAEGIVSERVVIDLARKQPGVDNQFTSNKSIYKLPSMRVYCNYSFCE